MKFNARSWGRPVENVAIVEDAGFTALEADGIGVELRVRPEGGIGIWMTNGTDDGGGKYERLIGVVEPGEHSNLPAFTQGSHLGEFSTGRWPVDEEDEARS